MNNTETWVKRFAKDHLKGEALSVARFLYQLVYQRGPRGDLQWWDKASPRTVETIAAHLSNPDDPERLLIRGILSDMGIKTVLDAGCGPAAEKTSYDSDPGLCGIGYVGLDLSRRMLNYARERTERLVQGEISGLPFANGSFEAVIIKHVLEHQPQGFTAVVEEAVRVARKLVVVDFFQPPLPFGLKASMVTKQGGVAVNNNWYSRADWLKFLRQLKDQKKISSWQVYPCHGPGTSAQIHALTI